MIKQMYILSGFFAICGLTLVMRPNAHIAYTESDIERAYPDSLGAYHMRPDATGSDPHQSYHMDETTYRALQPYGIVCRVLDNGKTAYDVVVIAGDQPDTFHNPLVCFASQDYKVLESQQIMLKTKSRGEVPCMLAQAQKGDRTQYALYTYEGPTKMAPENTDLFKDMFFTQVFTAVPHSATFFRFLTLDSATTKEDLETFAANYLDASPVRPKLGHA